MNPLSNKDRDENRSVKKLFGSLKMAMGIFSSRIIYTRSSAQVGILEAVRGILARVEGRVEQEISPWARFQLGMFLYEAHSLIEKWGKADNALRQQVQAAHTAISDAVKKLSRDERELEGAESEMEGARSEHLRVAGRHHIKLWAYVLIIMASVLPEIALAGATFVGYADSVVNQYALAGAVALVLPILSDFAGGVGFREKNPKKRKVILGAIAGVLALLLPLLSYIRALSIASTGILNHERWNGMAPSIGLLAVVFFALNLAFILMLVLVAWSYHEEELVQIKKRFKAAKSRLKKALAAHEKSHALVEGLKQALAVGSVRRDGLKDLYQAKINQSAAVTREHLAAYATAYNLAARELTYTATTSYPDLGQALVELLAKISVDQELYRVEPEEGQEAQVKGNGHKEDEAAAVDRVAEEAVTASRESLDEKS